MKHLKITLLVVFALASQVFVAQNKIDVEPFNKVIISPHIETTFIQGNEESVTIIDSKEPEDKINIEVKGETLRVYLDGAKELTKQKKVIENGQKWKTPIYKDKVLTIVVTYKSIDELSLRGEQMTLCKSPIETDNFNLKIYGESQVVFNEINFKSLDVDVYGESQLTIKKGQTDFQKVTAYGEGEINLIGIDNKISKLKAFGEAEFKVNASERIKFTAFGEAELHYKGNAKVNKGLGIGASRVERIK